MSDPVRPWWASSDADAADDVDPVEAFRTARRPRPAPAADPSARTADPATDGAGGDRADRDDTAAADGAPDGASAGAGTGPAADGPRERGSGADDTGTHRPELCGVCPICTLGRVLEEHHPDLAVHLGEAARHLGAALRVLLDPPASTGPPPRDRGVQHIDLDPDPDGARGGEG